MMRNFLEEIRAGFGNATGLYRIIFINIAVFLLWQLARLVVFFSGGGGEMLHYYAGELTLPAWLPQLMKRPWSLLTYMFLHFDFMHILFNMLILYWTGKLFTEYLGNDKLWATYISGGLAGAFCYMAIYNLFPVFEHNIATAQLLGASAGVIAVMVAIATLLPDYTVQLLLFGPVRLKYIAIISILLYAISIPDGNAGGNIAHLGGAFFGFIMIKQLKNGRDLNAWLIKLRDRFTKPRMRIVESKKQRRHETDADYAERKRSQQEVIDRILDKISQSGYESLTSDEKDILFKASKNIKD